MCSPEAGRSLNSTKTQEVKQDMFDHVCNADDRVFISAIQGALTNQLIRSGLLNGKMGKVCEDFYMRQFQLSINMKKCSNPLVCSQRNKVINITFIPIRLTKLKTFVAIFLDFLIFFHSFFSYYCHLKNFCHQVVF